VLKIDINQIESIIREVAKEEILPKFRNLAANQIEHKNPNDPVTIADRRAEIALSNHFLSLLPGSLVVGEEQFHSDRGLLRHFFGDSPVWIVDPIDGTRAFIEGKPYFGVIVALAKHNETIAGWLYDPLSDEFVTAEKGSGAFYKGRRMRVLASDKLDNMVGSIGFALGKKLKKAGARAPKIAPDHKEMGYACHDYARMVVAEPHFSRRGGPLHFRASLSFCTPWDDAAGVLIHQEAGGFSGHWDRIVFRPSSYHKGLMLAPDRESWEALREWVSGFVAFD